MCRAQSFVSPNTDCDVLRRNPAQADEASRCGHLLLCRLLANVADAAADSASDQDMANRYLQAAKSGDDYAQFYLGVLYSADVGLPRSDEEAFRWVLAGRRSRTFARDADHERPLCDRARRPEGPRQGIRVRHYRQLGHQGRRIP
jgi:hypothetical protein